MGLAQGLGSSQINERMSLLAVIVNVLCCGCLCCYLKFGEYSEGLE